MEVDHRLLIEVHMVWGNSSWLDPIARTTAPSSVHISCRSHRHCSARLQALLWSCVLSECHPQYRSHIPTWSYHPQGYSHIHFTLAEAEFQQGRSYIGRGDSKGKQWKTNGKYCNIVHYTLI